VAWEEIIFRNRNKISHSSEKRRVVSETASSPQKKVLKKLVAEETGKKRKRVVSLQLPLPSMSGHLRSWRSANNMRNTEEGAREGEGGERGRERHAKAGKVKAVSMGSRTVGFGYESYTASTQPVPMPIPMPKPDNKNRNCSSRRGRRIREPEESWLDLDDSPTSTIGRATPVRVLSTMVVARPPPVTPPSLTEGSVSLKTLLQTYLTTTLLSLEIDIAQLDTRLFLIFDQLRTVHTSLLLRIPGITMAPAQASQASATLKPISTAEGKSKLRTLRSELAALDVQMTGYMETISIVEMQIMEALGEKDIFADGVVVVEDLAMSAGELQGQVKTVKDELGRLERKRSGLGEWAGEVWVGWNFGAGEAEEDVGGKTQVPALTVGRAQSAPVTPVSGPSYLTVPERSDLALGRNRSMRGSRSMGSIKANASSASFFTPPSNRSSEAIARRKPAPPNVNKPLPASPGDGDFEMETRYIRERSRSRSPAPPPLERDTEPVWDERSTLLPPSPTSARAPTIPDRNPKRIVPRTGPPPEPEFDVGLALSVPSSNTTSSHAPPPLQTANLPVSAAALQPQPGLEDVNGQRDSFASARFSLDLTNLDQLITSSARRSPADVYQDFFSTHSAISEDNSSYRSRYSRGEDEALRQGWDNEEEDEEGEFELPPLLPSIGPDSVFSSTNQNTNSSNKHNNRASIASSCDNSSTPTTPGSTSPATPYTPFTPFTPGPTYTPHAKPHQRCSYSIHRKPIPSAQASPKIPDATSSTTIPVSTTSSTTAIATPSSSSTTSSTSQSQPEQTFTFYSPSSFPQPPALKDLERKVQRESTLRTTPGWSANGADSNGQWQGGEYAHTYPEMEIELLQCPPRGIVYAAPVPPVPQPDPAPAPVALGSTPEKVGVWKRFGMKGGREKDEGSHSESQGHLQEWEDGSAGVAISGGKGGKEGKEGKRWSTMGMGKGMGKNSFWRIRGGSKDLAKEQRAVKVFTV